MTKALIGAGCFWGVEEYYINIKGIVNTKVGYSGGNIPNPTYEDVCTGMTEHVEVLKIEFDSKIISYKEILNHFWNCHDSTQKDRQGPDVGRQYRSVIFFYSDLQKLIAIESKKEKQLSLSSLIQTEISPAKEFFLAEEYHQKFIRKKL